MKTLLIELKRMYRNHTLQLSVFLLILIAVLGIALNEIYYSSLNDSRLLLLSLYNSFTQFTYLILAFVFISVFCKDFQNGVYIWYKQMGYSFIKVIISKFFALLITVLSTLNIIFILAQLFSNNEDYGFFCISLVCVNLNIIYIIVLSLFLSIIFKKVIVSTLLMYGMYVLFNGLNLWLYGIFNPADSNSLTTYYLGRFINASQSHYSLSKINMSDELLRVSSITIPIIWSIALVIAAIFIEKFERKKVYEIKD